MTHWRAEYPDITHHGNAMVLAMQNDHDREQGYLRVARPLVGVEVGVYRGKNAATLLARMPQLRLYLVDYWGQAPTNDPLTQSNMKLVDEALRETRFARHRRITVHSPSPAARHFVNEPLDFVFVDGDHSYEACLADLQAWWPLVRPGGFMFGHDIDHPEHPEWGVRRALEEFAGGNHPEGRERLSFRVIPWPAMVFAIQKPAGQ